MAQVIDKLVTGYSISNKQKLLVPDRRQTGYAGPMASEGICPGVLDMAVETKPYWPSRNQERNQGVDQEDGASEPVAKAPTVLSICAYPTSRGLLVAKPTADRIRVLPGAQKREKKIQRQRVLLFRTNRSLCHSQ